MTAELVQLWGREMELVTFPIVARRRSDGVELLRLPGLDTLEDLTLLTVIATEKTGPVDAYDVRDPGTVLWASDLPNRRERVARENV